MYNILSILQCTFDHQALSFDIINVLTHFCILNQYINSNVNYQMATVGYLIGESTPTIGYGMDVHHTIANN